MLYGVALQNECGQLPGSAMMEMYVTNDEVIQLQAGLVALNGSARLFGLVRLAWYQSERDTHQALACADEAENLLQRLNLDARQKKVLHARLMLVRGIARWLFAEPEQATELAQAALTVFQEQHDDTGCADAWWLLAWIENARGEAVLRDRYLQHGIDQARKISDWVRLDIMEAEFARLDALRDVNVARERWGSHFSEEINHLPLAVAACVTDYLFCSASLYGDYGKSTALGMKTYDAALATGQIRRAIFAATNIGDDFNNLNDHHAALEWMQRALELARPTGWPGSIGAVLMQTAGTLRRLGRLEAAQEMLCRALDILAVLPGSRTYAIALDYLGTLALDRGDYPLALDTFRQLHERAEGLNQSDVKSAARNGEARALLELQRPQEALVAAQLALDFAREKGASSAQIAALKVLADIHARHPLPPPEGMTALNAPLHYLQQVLEIAASIDGYTVPGDLLDAIGREYANVGAFAQAYRIGLQANAARAKTHSQEATNRAIAMQVQHQTERARAEGEHHKQLAAVEAKRAEVLQQTSATLARLSAIGQEITAHLETADVFQALRHNVHGLLDVSSFCVFLMESNGLALDRAFGVEGDQMIPPGQVLISDPLANSARCVRERCEILIDLDPGQETPNFVPGTLRTLSLLFAPLMIGERVLGVMTIQSTREHAYSERERLIFRTLCAYGAIALDNAAAYRRLQQLQAQLVAQEKEVAQEKLAALGAMVAGVAHELNTPLGNSLMMASAMQENIFELNAKIARQNLQRGDLQGFLLDAQEATTLITRGLSSAINLVRSFMQVAVDRATEHRRVFDLQQTLDEIVATMMSKIRPNGHEIKIEIPADIEINSYPGPLGQVITSLIHNALLHGFEGREGGHMRLWTQQVETGRVQILFEDDGVGIPEQNISRIFDPFFTTKMGQGGNGLGLNISYNIVTSLLNGHISVKSVAGEGTTFTIDLPLTAPEQQG
jgi:signal transduction histidine kinase/tetratricopeptide (TPR) repeat protein